MCTLHNQLYTALVLLTPSPIPTAPSEQTFRSRDSPSKSLPLPTLSDPAEVDLTVVIPAYNETARLPSMLSSTLAHLRSLPAKKQNRTYELLIVDDGSSDDTAKLSLRLADENPDANIRVVELTRNRGKGGAVRHGMLHSRGRRMLMVDADGASNFEDLELLWDAMDAMEREQGQRGELKANGDAKKPNGNANGSAAKRTSPDEDVAAVVVGSRAHLVKTEAVVKRSLLRNILMYGLHTLLRLVNVGHIRDTQCGFKLFSRRAAAHIFPAQHLATWIFDVELLLLAKQLGIAVCEVPVGWHEVAGSKLNVVRDSLQMLRDLLVLRGNQLTGRWKVQPMERKR
ncbi:glycosyltransferase family 2 protein [Coniophora puteana RWD-64-598 SS2]|uniref:dolichyl-phosphate beta-glucosyltransferase n=1 Tax=Coniophora puteana (strain RWD-64-598) TaxID=741705 RepID=A0A5M3M7T7_CONPW|nr:glycosyltransferase family 2 protein [Coniophora puteana RWD-64-598 SS2]EIW75103.1 glycosyltransferase family 2 protein [Coniophora puteana RWD-64-598 SS2]